MYDKNRCYRDLARWKWGNSWSDRPRWVPHGELCRLQYGKIWSPNISSLLPVDKTSHSMSSESVDFIFRRGGTPNRMNPHRECWLGFCPKLDGWWGGAKLPCRAASEFWVNHPCLTMESSSRTAMILAEFADGESPSLPFQVSSLSRHFQFYSLGLSVPKVVIPWNQVAGDGRSPHLVPCTNPSSRPCPQWATPHNRSHERIYSCLLWLLSAFISQKHSPAPMLKCLNMQPTILLDSVWKDFKILPTPISARQLLLSSQCSWPRKERIGIQVYIYRHTLIYIYIYTYHHMYIYIYIHTTEYICAYIYM